MSNQFYNYIAEHLIEYFNNTKIKNGDRFYLQLDTKDELNQLVSAIKNSSNHLPFVYTHELGDEYSTFCLPFENLKLVVAHTSANVSPDFLVTLRNQVGEQKDVWNNTALLSIVTEQLDSILGGSSDLQKEGMPLHPNYLFKKIKTEIEDKIINKVEQIVLMDNLTSLMKEQAYQKLSFFDFENIFNVVDKGRIEDTDYINFGLFKDENLTTVSGNKLKDRLSINRELFDYVKKVQDYGLKEEELERKFMPDLVKKFKSEEWNEVEFKEVFKSYEEKIAVVGKTKVELVEWQVRNNLKYWEKPLNEKSAGKRKKHIIIFNPEHQNNVELNFAFSITGSEQRSLSEKYLKIPSKQNLNYSLGRSNLKLQIECERFKTTFTKVSYKHENRAALGVELNIAVIPIRTDILENYKTQYLVDSKNNALEIQYEGNSLFFGEGIDKITQLVEENNKVIYIDNDQIINIIPSMEALSEEELVQINLCYEDNLIPLVLKNELPESTPITGSRIWKLKREQNMDYEWRDNKLLFGNREFYLHPEYKQFFEWEKEWISKKCSYACIDSGKLRADSIDLPEDIRESYSRFITLFKIKRSIPSLCHYDDELTARAKKYVSEYIKQIQLFEEGKEAGEKGRNLFKLGTLTYANEVYFTPYHPLMVAFQLKANELVKTEELETSILNRLKPDSLIPFIYQGKENLLKPDTQNAALEWIVFKPVNQVSIADANQYLAKVVEDKISQFMEHFSYLFIEQAKAPLKLNIINISNDREVLKGILQWMIRRIDKYGPEQLVPLEINLYQSMNTISAFDEFSRMESITDIEHSFGVKLKVSDYDEQDTIRFIREKLYYFKHNSENEIKYAHISFYKMEAQENYALQPMNEMLTGLAVQGLYSSVPSMKGKENYRSGFGIKAHSIDPDNLLIETAFYANELAANLRNEGSDSYHKGEAIFSRTTTADEDTLDKIFNSSYWVTFIDPTTDLEFFNNYGNNLVVIHYSDQYSSSSRFDAITVTNKSNQYHAVIKEFLQSKNIEIDEKSVEETILAFNTFNGEWLLRIIGSKGQYSREKLSIISAIKYSLSYFDHQDILWVPVSLEEILRVAGAVSLNKTDGIFTAKNLGVKGKHSDDLLLIGLENTDGQLKIHFLPVEVKIGINASSTIEKAKEQLRNTKRLIQTAVSAENFTSKFYRNFFVQLFISNATKIAQSRLWTDKNYSLSEETIEQLLKDKYSISNDLEGLVGLGTIISFQKDIYVRDAFLKDGVSILNLTEQDGYKALVKPITNLCNWIQTGKSDFVKEDLISNLYGNCKTAYVGSYTANVSHKTLEPSGDIKELPTSIAIKEEEKIKEDQKSDSINKNEYNINAQPNDSNIEIKDINDKPTYEESENVINKSFKPIQSSEEKNKCNSSVRNGLEDSRILIGKVANSNRDIYWEYGNKGLANRHLLISGKSGQGKTYFMQCLLLEKSKQGIPSIVIDYTEGFLPNQLEPEFVEYLGDKYKQTVVYIEKFPINPFKKNIREISGLTLPESETDVAERIKSVFSAVYKTLGIQQLNAIYEATLRGLEIHGDHMDLIKLKVMLEEDGSSYAKTALSQIRPLIDRNPFKTGDSINWDEVVSSNGEVYIIQLTGYPRDVQLMITEFILWDLWNFSVRHGNKNKPMPVIMDEAQNLDHTEKSPSARILTEGRKFGWSAWYATQFLKSQLDAGELARLQNASQQIYFAPPEQEISTIASNLAQDASEKKHWESKLSGLKKGQCIVYGPIALDNGELTKPTGLIVNIAPLDKRI